MIYYNTVTNEYPRYQGDLELLGWNAGEPLPENWVEVEFVDMPQLLENQTVEELLPAQGEDGIWRMQWAEPTFLTQEQVDAKLAAQAEYRAWEKSLRPSLEEDTESIEPN
jgi:hypothetical protein